MLQSAHRVPAGMRAGLCYDKGIARDVCVSTHEAQGHEAEICLEQVCDG